MMSLNIIKKLAGKIPDKSYLNLENIKMLAQQLTGKLRDNYNVVIISIDTLRKDHLGCYGYRRNTTPNIDKLAEKGVVFKNAFSNSAWTVPGHMSLLTGLFPSNHGLIYYPDPGCIHESIATIGSILQKQGYLTRGFHGAGYVRGRFGFDRGFHQYTTRGNNFEDNLQPCLGWLEKAKKFRFFLFLHGFNCHNPFKPSPEVDVYYKDYKGSFSVEKLYSEHQLPANKDDIEHVIAKYDATILGADIVLGRLFEKLERLKILSKTIIIIVSDHGHGFGEHESYGHATLLYDEVIRVPMIMYGPGIIPEGREIEGLVSLVDIAPTVLSILNIKNNLHFDGVDILPLIKNGAEANEAVFSETGIIIKKRGGVIKGLPKKYMLPLIRCIRTKEWKLVIDNNDKPFELFDLTKDIGESLNVADDRRDIAEKLLNKFFDRVPKRAADLSPPESLNDFDEELKQQLKALGYL